MSVAVVTDTTAYLPQEICLEKGIKKVSLYVNWAKVSKRESDLGNLDHFYRELKTSEEVPTTSQPSVGDFIDVYRPLIESGQKIFSIHLSAGISGTCESALKARSQLAREGADESRIAVFDSQSAAGGLGIMAIAAVRMAQNGAPLEGVMDHVLKTREDFKMWFVVDTLEFLRRGGRIGAASAWIGTTLKIKPILSFESEITQVERVRTGKRAFERILDFARQRKESGSDAWVVQHIQAPDQAKRLADSVQEIMGREPVYVSEVGPVIGAHIGPGLLGFGSVRQELV